MPRQSLTNSKSNMNQKRRGLIDMFSKPEQFSETPFQAPDDLSTLSGFHDEPLVQEPAIHETLGARRPPEMTNVNIPNTPKRRSMFPNVNESLIDAVVQVESSGQWDAVSRVGAVGLMQIRPQYAIDPGYGAKSVFDVAEQMGRRIDHIPQDPDGARRLLMDPEVNRAHGTQYLKALTREFDGNTEHALVAYNWGPTAARRWIADGADKRRLPAETRNYLKKIETQLESGEENASTT